MHIFFLYEKHSGNDEEFECNLFQWFSYEITWKKCHHSETKKERLTIFNVHEIYQTNGKSCS